MNPALKMTNKRAIGRPFTGKDDPRWKPGTGRPPRVICIPDILREIGAEIVDPDSKRTKLQELMRRVYDVALQGQGWAVEYISSRTEGKVTDRLAIEPPSDVWERARAMLEKL